MPKSKEIKLSIIIVNYRSEHYLDKCLASIYSKSDSKYFEVIIVNNDQETELKTIEQKYIHAKIYNLKKNIGFGRACNYGAEKSTGSIFFFLNPDTQFLNNFVEYILEKFSKSEEKIGIIGPRLLTDNGETQIWCTGKDLTVGQRIKNHFWIIESKEIWESKEELIVDWVSGAALAIKNEVFKKIYGFDEKFFMYGEDLDLCARARDLGYKILYCPKISVLHSGGKSRKSFFRQKIQFFKSSLYYIKKRRQLNLNK
ncbi:MAG: hypothetical protein ACD_15C00059G0005 [uncultured bacterium]|nr:MAG: hypothetical protein ACD_15C00059G0005 [uncultured bacterium]HCU70756.1 hypothetical protein [Candidatus Moranbacteria bacterium]